MNFANIKFNDIANGEGIRTSLFVSGCTHHCKHCFNPETWDFNFGEEFTAEHADQIIENLKPSYIKGFSLLGGEPFERENRKALADLAKKVRQEQKGKSIWCFSGFLFSI